MTTTQLRIIYQDNNNAQYNRKIYRKSSHNTGLFQKKNAHSLIRISDINIREVAENKQTKERTSKQVSKNILSIFIMFDMFHGRKSLGGPLAAGGPRVEDSSSRFSLECRVIVPRDVSLYRATMT